MEPGNNTKTASFHILAKLIFISHSTIWCYIVWKLTIKPQNEWKVNWIPVSEMSSVFRFRVHSWRSSS
jgi:hypothetical protein